MWYNAQDIILLIETKQQMLHINIHAGVVAKVTFPSFNVFPNKNKNKINLPCGNKIKIIISITHFV